MTSEVARRTKDEAKVQEEANVEKDQVELNPANDKEIRNGEIEIVKSSTKMVDAKDEVKKHNGEENIQPTEIADESNMLEEGEIPDDQPDELSIGMDDRSLKEDQENSKSLREHQSVSSEITSYKDNKNEMDQLVHQLFAELSNTKFNNDDQEMENEMENKQIERTCTKSVKCKPLRDDIEKTMDEMSMKGCTSSNDDETNSGEKKEKSLDNEKVVTEEEISDDNSMQQVSEESSAAKTCLTMNKGVSESTTSSIKTGENLETAANTEKVVETTIVKEAIQITNDDIEEDATKEAERAVEIEETSEIQTGVVKQNTHLDSSFVNSDNMVEITREETEKSLGIQKISRTVDVLDKQATQVNKGSNDSDNMKEPITLVCNLINSKKEDTKVEQTNTKDKNMVLKSNNEPEAKFSKIEEVNKVTIEQKANKIQKNRSSINSQNDNKQLPQLKLPEVSINVDKIITSTISENIEAPTKEMVSALPTLQITDCANVGEEAVADSNDQFGTLEEIKSSDCKRIDDIDAEFSVDEDESEITSPGKYVRCSKLVNDLVVENEEQLSEEEDAGSINKNTNGRKSRVMDSSSSDSEDRPNDNCDRNKTENLTDSGCGRKNMVGNVRDDESSAPEKDCIRKSSIIIQENVNVTEIKDTCLAERIKLVIDSFCKEIHDGEFSMKLSLDYVGKKSSGNGDVSTRKAAKRRIEENDSDRSYVPEKVKRSNEMISKNGKKCRLNGMEEDNEKRSDIKKAQKKRLNRLLNGPKLASSKKRLERYRDISTKVWHVQKRRMKPSTSILSKKEFKMFQQTQMLEYSTDLVMFKTPKKVKRVPKIKASSSSRRRSRVIN